jgi:signal transduction histidine kinase
MLQVADFPHYFAALKVRKTVSTESAGHDPRTIELQETYLAPLGITSLLDGPILIDAEIQGVVCHEQIGSMREWTTEGRDFAGSVADTGGGMAPGVVNRIFDPFFTTKSRERGSGLGLTIDQQAVERAGGDLRVENRPGEGATFVVLLPRVSGS